jgi:hypothetical protein
MKSIKKIKPAHVAGESRSLHFKTHIKLSLKILIVEFYIKLETT